MKKWKEMSLEEKVERLYKFDTIDSICIMLLAIYILLIIVYKLG